MYEKKTINILHVDDEEAQLMFTKHFLQTLDETIVVDSIIDPQEALQQISKKNYDVIISDYKMPKINGVQLAHKIKKNKNIPIIIYSGQDDYDVIDSAKSEVDYYVKKELNPHHYYLLYKRIVQVIETNQLSLRTKNRVTYNMI